MASGPVAVKVQALASGPVASKVQALASGPVALASKVQALGAALTIFCHHYRTHGPTTTTKIKLKVCL